MKSSALSFKRNWTWSSLHWASMGPATARPRTSRDCLLADAPFAFADEFDQMFDFGKLRQIGFDFRKRIGNRQFLAKKNFVCLLQRALGFFRNMVPFQTNFVDRARNRWIAVREHVRRD